ncbi:cytochrome d ubiquinol oxidase subunit II [Methylobacterium bullatum]|uniref:Cytochrome bd-I ubiquinol oxidase subunit 2 n=1 Tax=Methylobacterium bullatum TaxID=570505 RepID=A0AAV4Z3Q9_9HYPH|nr:cytochrome d ubiquinol oxidase subunit II [Methylobacterium bullatum]MBD8904080.1 cytochrome d ubiquinol oxidase subunit II [Methylobacterium bullatum]GJD38704.1 Cytochrome bd-I ubiquinol oxidase subunit 2 [Methylobacterium bullatum]
MSLDLTLIWAILIATAVFLYVVMDGFDLGIGILFPTFPEKADRDVMVNTVAPVWDGNETWLILGGGGLFAVFPLAYATLLPALYMPITLMLLALVFRGVAFEMRFRAASAPAQTAWDAAFALGSYGAAFCQGICLGALVQGIRVEGRAYAGGWWDWLTPFSLLTGLALVAGYALLGACWLIWKTEGVLQLRAFRLARALGFATLFAIAAVSVAMPFLSPAFRGRWLTWPAMALAAPVPLLVAALGWRFLAALDRREEVAPFLCGLGLFLLSYIGLGISLFPMIVPPTVTIWDAATHPSSQLFLLVGTVVLLSMVLAYTGYVYWLFRGKVTAGAPGYH